VSVRSVAGVCLFGEIVGWKVVLNPVGDMIQTVWGEVPFHFAGIETDEIAIVQTTCGVPA
jgi:hypothetical protein